MAETKTVYLEDVSIGDEVPAQVRSLTTEEVREFLLVWQGPQGMAQLSRFHSEEHAKKEGLPGPIVPGIMCMALISKMLTDWSPSVHLKKMDVVFRQVVPHNIALRLYGVVTNVDEQGHEVEVDIYVEPPDGQPFIRGMAVLGLLPRQS